MKPTSYNKMKTFRLVFLRALGVSERGRGDKWMLEINTIACHDARDNLELKAQVVYCLRLNINSANFMHIIYPG